MENELTPPELRPAPETMRFTGTGGEYFRIWIVNLLLSIVTVGIYSAWAKVRRLQYFYRSTELAGTGFEYHGKPMAILVGRVLAVLMLLIYKYSLTYSPALGASVFLLLLLVSPWLFRSSLRFRLHNSSYRSLRFGFKGTLGGAYWATFFGFLMMILVGVAVAIAFAISKLIGAILIPIAGLLFFFVLYPAWYRAIKAYQHNGARYGQSAFSFHATLGQYSWIFFLTFAILLGIGVVTGILAGVLGSADLIALPKPGEKPDPKAFAALAPLLGVFYIGVFLFIGPFFRARMDNLIWNSTRLGEHRIESRLSAWRLFGLYLTNLVGIVCTLGFFWPWAMVRLARYRAESLTLIPAESLDKFVASHDPETNAIGEEAFSVFDFDIAL
jgi:uncharacterized membrane protein YjgN (DUF898 family)